MRLFRKLKKLGESEDWEGKSATAEFQKWMASPVPWWEWHPRYLLRYVWRRHILKVPVEDFDEETQELADLLMAGLDLYLRRRGIFPSAEVLTPQEAFRQMLEEASGKLVEYEGSDS